MEIKKEPVSHHHISFAIQHYRGTYRTFNAASAIWRMTILIEEIENLANVSGSKPFPGLEWNEPQFPEYYLVAFVTCLEWHARSRLADFLSYTPECTTPDDLKAVTEGKKLLEMVAKRLTISELVGASTNISKFTAYLSVFDRIFGAANVNKSASNIIKSCDVPGRDSTWVILDRLFATRHTLVHEITNEQVGHRNLRMAISLEQALFIGQTTLQCMQVLEAHLTNIADSKFPNLLNERGYPVSRSSQYRSDIQNIEARILACLDNPAAHDPEIADTIDIELVKISLKNGRMHVESEIRSLWKFRPAGWKYFNPADDLELNLLSSRYSYLIELEKTLRETYGF